MTVSAPTPVSSTTSTAPAAAAAAATSVGAASTGTDVLGSLYRLLAENNLSEHTIWEGDPQLFPILYQFRNLFAQFNQETPFPVQFILPKVKEFEGNKLKNYNIMPRMQIRQAIGRICKKFSVPNPDDYALCTLKGFVMKGTETFSTYGLGVLFETWQLLLIPKKAHKSTRNAARRIELESVPESSGVAEILLPPMVEFSGLKKTKVMVKSHEPISAIVDRVKDKYRVETEEVLCLVTTSNKARPNFVLDSTKSLLHYGMGTKLPADYVWQLQLQFEQMAEAFDSMNSDLRLVQLEDTALNDIDLRELAIQIDSSSSSATELAKSYENEATIAQDKFNQMVEAYNQLLAHSQYQESRIAQLEAAGGAEQSAALTQARAEAAKESERFRSAMRDADSKLEKEKGARAEAEADLRTKLTRAREELKLAERAQRGAEMTMRGLQEQVEVLEKEKAAAKEAANRAEKAKEAVEAKVKTIIAKVKTQVTELQREREEEKRASAVVVQDLEARLAALGSTGGASQAALNAANVAREEAEARATRTLEQAVADQAAAQKSMAAAEARVAALEKEVVSLRSSKESASAQSESTKQFFEEAMADKARILEEKRTVEAAAAEAATRAEAERAKLTTSLAEATASADEARATLTELELSVSSLESRLATSEASRKEAKEGWERTRAELEDMSESVRLAETEHKAALKLLTLERDEVKEALERTQAKLAKAETDASSLRSELDAFKDEAEEEEQRLKQRLAEVDQALAEARDRTAEQAAEIEKLSADLAKALAPPPPPPLPTLSKAKLLVAEGQAANAASGDGEGGSGGADGGKIDMAAMLANKDRLKKTTPVERPKFDGKEGSLESVLFSSLQTRFQAVQGAGVAEDLGDDDEWD